MRRSSSHLALIAVLTLGAIAMALSPKVAHAQSSGMQAMWLAGTGQPNDWYSDPLSACRAQFAYWASLVGTVWPPVGTGPYEGYWNAYQCYWSGIPYPSVVTEWCVEGNPPTPAGGNLEPGPGGQGVCVPYGDPTISRDGGTGSDPGDGGGSCTYNQGANVNPTVNEVIRACLDFCVLRHSMSTERDMYATQDDEESDSPINGAAA